MLSGKWYQTCLELSEALSTIVRVPLHPRQAYIKVCNYPIHILQGRRCQAVIGLAIVREHVIIVHEGKGRVVHDSIVAEDRIVSLQGVTWTLLVWIKKASHFP